MPIVILLAVILALPAAARDHDFDAFVRDMESHYGTRRLRIPFLGLANFVVKVARPAGTSDLKLAVFEHVNSDRHPTAEGMDAMVAGGGWLPFVRVKSNRNGERVQIYQRTSHRDHELLITTFERREAVMVRVRVNPESLARWVNHPSRMARSKGGDRD